MASKEELSRVWCISPSYFDAAAYGMLREQIRGVLGSEFPQFSPCFIVVDDSAGADAAIVSLSDMDTRIIVPPFNLGHQRALVYALRLLRNEIAETDYVMTLDSDGEDRGVDLPRLLTALLDVDSASPSVVMARRTSRITSLRFKVLYFFFVLLFRLLTGVVVRTGNFACYSGRTLHRMIGHPYFDQCYSSTLVALKLQHLFVDCARGRRLAGESKMRIFELLMHGHRMLMPFVDRIAVRALVFVAIMFFSASVVLGYSLIGAYLAWECYISPGYALFLLGFCLLLFWNFVVLFTVFSQSTAVSLRGLEGD